MRVEAAGFRGGDRTQPRPAARAAGADEQVVAAAGAKPVALVLLAGSAVAVNWADEHVPAILQAWYPGQAGGTAVADVLFGAKNPGGRLPGHRYRSADDLPAFDDYAMKGRTYRFFTGSPLYPFGHGLSYGRFRVLRLAGAGDRRCGLGPADRGHGAQHRYDGGRRGGAGLRGARRMRPQARRATH